MRRWGGGEVGRWGGGAVGRWGGGEVGRWGGGEVGRCGGGEMRRWSGNGNGSAFVIFVRFVVKILPRTSADTDKWGALC